MFFFVFFFLHQVNTFTANYRGHPFMQSLNENTLLSRFTYVTYAVLFLSALEVFEPLNDLLQLARLPTPQFRNKLLAMLIGDTLSVLAIDKVCLKLFRT